MHVNDWLANTSAFEVMRRDIVTLQPNHVLAYAAAVLMQEQISGAPVVDESGHCVGVLSYYDLLHAEDKAAEEQEQVTSAFHHSGLALPMSVYQDQLARVRDKLVPAAQQPVRHFMTTDVVSVKENAPLESVIRDMVDAHIHRVVVVNEADLLMGLVTTTDILAALLRAGHEPSVP